MTENKMRKAQSDKIAEEHKNDGGLLVEDVKPKVIVAGDGQQRRESFVID